MPAGKQVGGCIVVDEATNVNDDRPVILLVEDEALTIMDLGDVLENGGYETVQCASAERALGIIQARPDICGLITDVELSGKTNGFELATAVSEARPKLPIVIVSGRAAPDPERMPAGARFIARPCTGEDILSQLKGLLPC
ncbi:MAG: response regulator [Methylobacterium sp.]|nr:response regulator [Methylobacterium sp.]